jgi:hypothetical protein
MKRCPPATRLRIDLKAALRIVLCVAPLSTAAVAEPTLPADTSSKLSFADFFKRPIGPRGLEPGANLLALAGARVSLSGFAATGPDPRPALAILAPVPVAFGDEDEGLADDLPASVAYLHWTDPHIARVLASCQHAVNVTGRLELGRRAEPDGRMSFVRLDVDGVQCIR